MTVERSVTRGNLLSMLTTALGFAATLVAVTLFISEIRADMREKDREHDTRIQRLEQDVGILRADHDTIVEMRQDVKAIRSLLDRIDRKTTPP